MVGPVKRWRIRRKLAKIEALKVRADEQMRAFPTRQLRRQAKRQVDKAFIPRRVRKSGRTH